jgi:hypothetical protein
MAYRLVVVFLVFWVQPVAAKGWGIKRSDFETKPTPAPVLKVVAGEGVDNAIACGAGKFKKRGASKKQCQACAPGRYSDFQDNHFCELCSSNKVQPHKVCLLAETRIYVS